MQGILTDKDDDKVIGAALVCDAGLIITGDEDLLAFDMPPFFGTV